MKWPAPRVKGGAKSPALSVEVTRGKRSAEDRGPMHMTEESNYEKAVATPMKAPPRAEARVVWAGGGLPTAACH